MIRDRLFFDLIPFLDLSMLHIEELELGLARAAKAIGKFGTVNVDPDVNDLGRWLEPPIEANEKVRALWAESRRSLHGYNSWCTYCKLAYGAYAPTNTVSLTTFNGSVPYSNTEVHKHELYRETENFKLFPSIKRFLEVNNIFISYGRVIFFIQDHLLSIPSHRDSGVFETNLSLQPPEFIWLSLCKKKQLYILDAQGIKHYVKSNAAWFNSGDVHGADPTSTMTWSLRIDGIFTEQWKTLLV